MPSLNLELDYFDNPKVRRLVGLLGKGAEMLPLRLWCYCGKHAPETGALIAISAQEIEAICAWWGQKGEAVAALVKLGFLHQDGNDYIIHDWLSHQGHIARYSKRGKEAAKARWAMPQACHKHATSIAVSMPQALPEQSRAEQLHTHTPDAHIPTLDEILEECDLRCYSKDSGEAFYYHHQGNGLWINQYGMLISWRDKLAGWAKKDREKETNGKYRSKSHETISESRNKYISGANGVVDNSPNRLPWEQPGYTGSFVAGKGAGASGGKPAN